MKKSKIALAAVVSAVLGTSALGLAACSDDDGKTPSVDGVYTITFDANGGAFAAGTPTPVTSKTIKGKLIAFPDAPTVAPSATPDYTFKGWALSANATADGAVSLNQSYTRDRTLYAIWGGEATPSGAYEITFNANGGTITSGPSTMTTVGGRLTSTLPTATYGTREFLGWYKVKDSTQESDKVVVNVTLFEEAGEVYASWGEESQIPPPVTERWVSFDANGGTFGIEDGNRKSIKTVNGVIADLPIPVRDGWEFSGYYKDPNLKDDPFTSTTIVEKDIAVYAHWKEINAAHSGKITIDGGEEIELTDNTSNLGTWNPNADDDKDIELSVTLKPGKDKELSITVDGKPIEFYLYEANGLRGTEGAKNSSVTTLTDGTYTLYIKHYPVNPQHNPARTEESWTLSATYTGATEEERADGIYVGDTRIDRVIFEEEYNQLKAEHIKLNKDDVVSFLFNGEEISVTMEAGEDNSKRVTAEKGKLVVLESGTFTFYVKLNKSEVWVTDEADAVESELQIGDGLIVGETLLKAFETFEGAHNEIRAINVEITEDTVVEIKYGGKLIADYTLKEDSKVPSSALVDGKLTLDAGTYEFYYRYDTKVLYVGKEGVSSIVKPTTPLTEIIVDGKKIELDFNEKGASGDLDTEYWALDITLMKGEKVGLTNGDTPATFWLDGYDDGTTKKALSVADASVLADEATVLKSGRYNLYIKHYPTGWVISAQMIESLGGDEEDPDEEHTGAYIIDGVETALNNNSDIIGTADVELFARGVSLNAGATLTFKADGKLVPTPLYGNNCHGASVNEATGVVTVAKTGVFDIYLRHYEADDKGNAACWTIEVNDGDVYEALADTYYIVGGMNGWSLAEDCDLIESDGDYTRTIELNDLVEFKIVLSDSDGKFVWEGQKTYTLKSKVAEKLDDSGNFRIIGGDGNYTITLSGTTVTVTKEGEAPDPTYEKDGVYVGGTLVKAFAEHTNPAEVKLEHVTFNAGDVLTFVYNGEEVSPSIKTDDKGNLCTTRIVKNGNRITCPDGGTFSIYYEFGANALWINDEADVVDSELQEGDGMIAGETVYAFKVNEGGLNEVYVEDVVLEAETALTLKYAGATVSDYTLKPGSLGTFENGVLTLPAGKYTFYYDYDAKAMYVAGKVDLGGDVDSILPDATSIVIKCSDGVVKISVKDSNGYLWGVNNTKLETVFLHVYGDGTDHTGTWKNGTLNGIYETSASVSAIKNVIIGYGNGGETASLDISGCTNGTHITLEVTDNGAKCKVVSIENLLD